MIAVPRNLKRWRAVLVAGVALTLFAAACGDDSNNGGNAQSSTSAGGATTSAAPAKPVAGGEATIELFSEIGTLDPVKMTASGGSDGQRGYALYGGLVI